MLKPALDALFKGALAGLALANGDGLTAQLLKETGVDTTRHQDWACTLARYAITARPGNFAVGADWGESGSPPQSARSPAWPRSSPTPPSRRARTRQSRLFRPPPADSAPAAQAGAWRRYARNLILFRVCVVLANSKALRS